MTYLKNNPHRQRPPKPPDSPENNKSPKPPDKYIWVKGHWRYDYTYHKWEWVNGHWRK